MLDSLSNELELKGTLHVLRHGFKCYGKTFRMAYFRLYPSFPNGVST